MQNASSPGALVVPPGGTKPKAKQNPIFFQIAALLLGAVVVILWAFVLLSLQPWNSGGPLEPKGNFAILALLMWCLIASVPIGLLILAIGLFVKKGYRSLRWVCIVTSLVVLSLPIIASFFLHRWHCP